MSLDGKSELESFLLSLPCAIGVLVRSPGNKKVSFRIKRDGQSRPFSTASTKTKNSRIFCCGKITILLQQGVIRQPNLIKVSEVLDLGQSVFTVQIGPEHPSLMY